VKERILKAMEKVPCFLMAALCFLLGGAAFFMNLIVIEYLYSPEEPRFLAVAGIPIFQLGTLTFFNMSMFSACRFGNWGKKKVKPTDKKNQGFFRGKRRFPFTPVIHGFCTGVIGAVLGILLHIDPVPPFLIISFVVFIIKLYREESEEGKLYEA